MIVVYMNDYWNQHAFLCLASRMVLYSKHLRALADVNVSEKNVKCYNVLIENTLKYELVQ